MRYPIINLLIPNTGFTTAPFIDIIFPRIGTSLPINGLTPHVVRDTLPSQPLVPPVLYSGITPLGLF